MRWKTPETLGCHEGWGSEKRLSGKIFISVDLISSWCRGGEAFNETGMRHFGFRTKTKQRTDFSGYYTLIKQSDCSNTTHKV
ncbi:hypothetical protein MAR_023724 [Mya arenaria]|uniref:Transposase n=1 Tax=Mya arenaria TaxID=6604 RepID=A0ABY7DRW9_MYAAR|nr:hypothetical protein MAR_023724 [Mya arenaria]